jgi:hypothetical protein
MQESVSASRLREMIRERHPEHFSAFADLFALGCFLHMNGKKEAGRKLVREVLNTVRAHGAKMYIESILDNLEGNESRFAADIHAHLEVNELFS